MKGYIFDIKKYSINDGPGIRTTVFFKGCPLKCWWCHNPESQRKLPEEFEECTFRWHLSHDYENKHRVGSEVTSDEVLAEIAKDIPFYEESKGGATFSGGEPMLQINFLNELLTLCKTNNITTAIDTTGYTDYKNFELIYNQTDLFLYDLKLMDDDLHIKYTGVSNKIIHENLKRIADTGNKVILRIPIIPSVNDTEKNLDEMIKFIRSLKNIREINLLPYHKSANSKYGKMKKENKLPELEPPSKEEMNQLKDFFASTGIKVKVGG
ncbi:MAG: glycyl-radical enzyme activating protein [Melioribacter sp.]|nr:glycyl-radical enzyme activating protein [Melioribacter sp.]